MNKIILDYIFRTSPNILFKRLSTASGLSEWFADDVSVKNEVYTFKWNGHVQSGMIKIDRKALIVKIIWIDDDKEYLEFRLEKSNMSKDLTLYITDFIDEDEDIDDLKNLWESSIDKLKTKLGIK